jgi:hypothetical protein
LLGNRDECDVDISQIGEVPKENCQRKNKFNREKERLLAENRKSEFMSYDLNWKSQEIKNRVKSLLYK